MPYEAVIGLEVHAQLLTRSKIFCGCSTAYGSPPNTHTCPVCLGLPGALPVLNSLAVAMAVKAGLALGCRINTSSIFARKNYFYPDLPKGYQISQYDRPLAENGCVRVWTVVAGSENARERSHREFGITRVHLEDDAGKSVHSRDGSSRVNLNRTGVPLIEIVSEPDFRSSQEAYDYLTHLRRTLLYLGICDGNMEEGSLRCDANVSIRPVGRTELGTKTEIKNLNSFRFLQKALEFEIARQSDVLDRGGEIYQETRLWDETLGKTFLMRSKEEAQDYRYFPEPDLPPIVVSDSWLEELRTELPELPEDRRQRLVREYGLEGEEALMATQSRDFAEFFERAVQEGVSARQVYNWMAGALTRRLKEDDRTISDQPIGPGQLGRLIKLIDSGSISGKIGKQVFETMYRTGDEPEKIVETEGLRQISDQSELEVVIERILGENPDQVTAFRGGKRGLIGFFVGQVMRETRGQANPQLVNEILQSKLDGGS